MPNPVFQELSDAVARNSEVDQSAIELINGIAERIETAVDAAVANGATEQELQPVIEEVNALRASNEQLAQSVAANTIANPDGGQRGRR